MAEVAVTIVEVPSPIPIKLVTWTALLNGDTGAPVELPDYADQTVTFQETFSVGGSVTLQGSNDGVTYYSLHDPQGGALTATAGGVEVVIETPRFIRPSVTAGDGSTSIEVNIFARRSAR